MYFGLNQGQITQNIDNRYVLKLIHLVAQCSKITNTVLFQKRIFHHFPDFCCFLLVMSECPKVHFVALRFIYEPQCEKWSAKKKDCEAIFKEDGERL